MPMNKLLASLKGERFRELFVYGVVGILTTAINYWSRSEPV